MTVDLLRSLGEKSARNTFPDIKQTSVHTPTDTRSGNVHVPSLSILCGIMEVPFMPYMDRPCIPNRHEAPMHPTQLWNIFRSEVMEMCHDAVISDDLLKRQ
jgi:hypothetical protein